MTWAVAVEYKCSFSIQVMHEDASLKRIWELSKKAKGDQLVFRALGISAWQSTQIERYSIECATPLAWISIWQLRWEHSICLTWCCILSGSKGVKREFLLLKKNAHRNTYMILPVCRRQSNINDKSLIPLGSDTQCYCVELLVIRQRGIVGLLLTGTCIIFLS